MLNYANNPAIVMPANKFRLYLMITALLLNQWLAGLSMACQHSEPGNAPASTASQLATDMPIDEQSPHCQQMAMHDMPPAAQPEPDLADSQMDCCDSSDHCMSGTSCSLMLPNSLSNQLPISSAQLLTPYQFSSLTSVVSQLAKPPQFA